MSANFRFDNLSRMELISIHSSINYILEGINEEGMECAINLRDHAMEEDKLFFSQQLQKIKSREKKFKEYLSRIPHVEYSLVEEMEAKYIPLEELEKMFE